MNNKLKRFFSCSYKDGTLTIGWGFLICFILGIGLLRYFLLL
jgi:hypothetical protein